MNHYAELYEADQALAAAQAACRADDSDANVATFNTAAAAQAAAFDKLGASYDRREYAAYTHARNS